VEPTKEKTSSTVCHGYNDHKILLSFEKATSVQFREETCSPLKCPNYRIVLDET